MKTKIRHPEKVNKPVNPIKKKPDWIRSKLLNSKEFFLTKTVVNVGYCESTSEWLNRIITELADESKNFVDLSVLCA